jgi:thiol:disulfide interchange protein
MPQNSEPVKIQGMSMGMILVMAAALLSAVIALVISNTGPKRQIKWQTNLKQTTRLARENQLPVMMYFTIDGCPPCKYMKTKVYPNPAVADLIETKFIPFKQNLSNASDEQVQFAISLGITAFPTIVFFNTDAREVKRIESAVAPDEMVNILQQVLKSVDDSTVE